MTLSTPGLVDTVKEPDDPSTFDGWDPAHVSPVLVALAKADCTINGATIFARGGIVQRFDGWQRTAKIERDERWAVEELEVELPKLLES